MFPITKGIVAVSFLALLPCLGETPPSANQPATQADDWGKADSIKIKEVPDIEPASRETIEQSLKAGVEFVLSNQNPDGSWGGHTTTKNTRLLCPWPSGPRTFRAACTALCIIGLEGTPMRDDPKIQQAIEKAEDFLFEEMPKIKAGNVRILYNGWAHAYVLESCATRAARMPKDSPRYALLEKCAKEQIEALENVAAEFGGWGYIYPDYPEITIIRPNATKATSFMTATVFVAFKSAEQVFGLKPDKKVFSQSMTFLKSQRTPSGTYVYSDSHSYKPYTLINRHTGSLARSPACDLSIKIYEPDYISIRQLHDDLERLWSRSGWLTMSLKKPKPHESFAKNSGYFVFYGYYYAALCIDILPEKTHKRHAALLAEHILPLQEKDGSWWDFPCYNYHKFYGTGYCLFALSKAWDALYGESKPAIHPATAAYTNP